MLKVPAILKLNRKKNYAETHMYMEMFKVDNKYFWNMYNELWKHKCGKYPDITIMQHVENTVNKIEQLDKIL